MSDLITIPSSEPAQEATVTVSAELAQPSVVIQYRVDAGPSAHSDNSEDNSSTRDPSTNAQPSRIKKSKRQPTRGLTGVLLHSVSAIARAGVRATVRHPRTSIWAVLSLMILGGILLTRPANPMPLAQVSPGVATATGLEKKPPDKDIVSKEHPENQQPKAVAQNETKKSEKASSPVPQPPAPVPPQIPPNGDNNIATEPPAPLPIESPKSSPLPTPSEPHPYTTTSTQSEPQLSVTSSTLADLKPELPTTIRTSVEAPLGAEEPFPPVPSTSDEPPAPSLLANGPMPTSKQVPEPSQSDSGASIPTILKPNGPDVSPQPTPSAPKHDSSEVDHKPKPSLPIAELPKSASSNNTQQTATKETTAKIESPKTELVAKTGTGPDKTDSPIKIEIPVKTETLKPDANKSVPAVKTEPSGLKSPAKIDPTVKSETDKLDSQAKIEANKNNKPAKIDPTVKSETDKLDSQAKIEAAAKIETHKSQSPEPKAASPTPVLSSPSTGADPLDLGSPTHTPDTSKPTQPEQPKAPKIHAPNPNPDPKPAPQNLDALPENFKPNQTEPPLPHEIELANPTRPVQEVLIPTPVTKSPRTQAPVDSSQIPTMPLEAITSSKVESPKQSSIDSATNDNLADHATANTASKKENTPAKPDESISATPPPPTNPSQNQAAGGWVRLPNTSKISEVLGGDSNSGDGVGDSTAESRRDRRSHADKDLGFEVESTRYASSDAADQSGVRPTPSPSSIEARATGSRLPNQSRPAAEPTKVEAVPHIVERDENFWTISRLYYSSGRFYRALWKANVQKYPNIEQLHVKDVIMIPPVEDLDPTYIDPPRNKTAIAGVEGTGRRSPTTSPFPAVSRSDSGSTTRTSRTTNSSSKATITAIRANRTDSILNLPTGETAIPREFGGTSTESEPANEGTLDDGSVARVTARPHNSAAVKRPTYKVRRHDTLRSIARDTLGDPRRDKEILSLNRDIIDDPSNLITGQLLELPADADSRRVTSRSR